MQSFAEVRLDVPLASSKYTDWVARLLVLLLLGLLFRAWILGSREMLGLFAMILLVVIVIRSPQRYELKGGKLRQRSGLFVLWTLDLADIVRIEPDRNTAGDTLWQVEGFCIYARNRARKIAPADCESFLRLLQQLDPELTRYGNELRRRPPLG